MDICPRCNSENTSRTAGPNFRIIQCDDCLHAVCAGTWEKVEEEWEAEHAMLQG